MNPNLIRTAVAVGRRLAAAGREAREASRSVAGPAGEQVIDAVAAAVGEVVRAAVAGAVAAAVRGASGPHDRSRDPWGAEEYDLVPVAASDGPSDDVPEWALATRAAGAALTVAAGAAAAVPGGRLVAAGLGALATVAGLAARAAVTECAD